MSAFARTWVGVALMVAAAGGVGAEDRLERFRETVAGRGDGEVDAAALYEVLDAEVLESLAGGGPFARAGFIQERLDGFAAAWGGGRFEIVAVASGGPVRALGVFALTSPAPAGSVRVYGERDGRPAVVDVLVGPGVPAVTGWAAGPAHWVVAWWGPESGHGRRPLAVEVRRADGDGFRRLWTLDAAPVDAAALVVERDRLVVRHATRYAGWKAGCDGQTEHEDSFRLQAGDRVVRAGRRVLNAWHAELGTAASRLFAALAAGDGRVLGEVVPDAALRRRLPATLERDEACDAVDVGARGDRIVRMAAADVVATGRRRPWELEWRRGAPGWRLTGAGPVLE